MLYYAIISMCSFNIQQKGAIMKLKVFALSLILYTSSSQHIFGNEDQAIDQAGKQLIENWKKINIATFDPVSTLINVITGNKDASKILEANPEYQTALSALENSNINQEEKVIEITHEHYLNDLHHFLQSISEQNHIETIITMGREELNKKAQGRGKDIENNQDKKYINKLLCGVIQKHAKKTIHETVLQQTNDPKIIKQLEEEIYSQAHKCIEKSYPDSKHFAQYFGPELPEIVAAKLSTKNNIEQAQE